MEYSQAELLIGTVTRITVLLRNTVYASIIYKTITHIFITKEEEQIWKDIESILYMQ